MVSFNILSLLFHNLRSKKVQKEIAERFLLNRITFSSWMHTLVYVRNVCAHHCRLWNRELKITPSIPKTIGGLWLSSKDEIKNNRTYYVIAIITYFLSVINPSSHFKLKLHRLLEKYPMIDLAAMGFPKSWNEEKLFQI